MPITQVSNHDGADRIGAAPARALRAIYARIGQLLVATDRLRRRGETAPPGRPGGGTRPVRSRPARPSPAAPEPAAPPARRSLDQTGNVRLLSADDLADEAPVAEPAASAAAPEAAAPEAAAPAEPAEPAEPGGSPKPPEAATPAPEPPAPEPQPAPAPAPPRAPAPAQAPAEAALPVPGYDSLSLPSLRARLRNLDTAQLRVLIAYEQAHAGRTDVITMFERRIAKLAGDQAAG